MNNKLFIFCFIVINIITCINYRYNFKPKLPDEILAEEKEMLNALLKREKMKNEIQNIFFEEYRKRSFSRLPDVMIIGVKKCGTKSLLTFLLQHPKISGCRKEFHWHSTGNFTFDLFSFLGKISRTKLTIPDDTLFISKTGLPVFMRIKSFYNETKAESFENIKIRSWLENVKMICT